MTKSIDNNIDNQSLSNDGNHRYYRYALKDDFVVNSREDGLAKEISEKFKDTSNFAFYRKAIQRLGTQTIFEIYKQTLDDIRQRHGTEKEIRSPAKLFTWKVSHYPIKI